MEYKAVIKCIAVIGIIFIVLSIIELIFSIIMATTEVNINGDKMLLQDLLFNPDILPIIGSVIWVFLNAIIVCSLVIGLLLAYIGIKKSLKERNLAILMTVLGMIILILSFTKMEYITLLAKTKLSLDNPVPFQTALYSQEAPLYVFWIFFMAVVCNHLITGLVISASGLKWILDFEKEKAEKTKES